MTPQELKASILQLAIQGKLVEQRPEEGTGGELLERIFAAKNAKDAKGAKKNSRAETRIPQPKAGREADALAGVRRRGKNDAASPREEIPDSEKPFDIPESWVWVRFGVIGQLLDGEKRAGKAYPCLDAKFLRGKCEAKYLTSGKFVSKGDKVILVDGENSGEVFAVPQDGYMGSTFKVLYCSPVLFEPYILYFLSYHQKDYRNNKKGAAIPHLNKDLFFDMPFPLPPLAEQKRIVAKIEELLPYIARYEKAWSKLEDFNKRFPGDMQKSLLQMAIQGKLVDQRPEEGTGEELYRSTIFLTKKVLNPISKDEVPFDIPSTWKWLRHNELFEIIGGSQPPKSKFAYIKKDGYVRLYQIRDYGENPVPVFVPQALVSKFTEKGDILLARYGASVGKVFWAEKGAYNVAMAKAKPLFEGGTVLMKYAYYYYLAPLYQSLVRNNSRSAQAGFNKDDLNGLLFPLPPLAEQKRIVAKLEELLPLCERLK